MSFRGSGLNSLFNTHLEKRHSKPTIPTRLMTSKNSYVKRVEIKNLFKKQAEGRLKDRKLSTLPLKNKMRTSAHTLVNESSGFVKSPKISPSKNCKYFE